jgi:hypothetical protein
MELDTTTPISRRTVTTAMAWSVPVIALAVATPGAAASVTGVVITPLDSFGAEPGESVPLVFEVSDNGVLVAGGVLTVVLDSTDQVEFDPEADGYSSPTVASVEITEGTALPIVLVKAGGAVSGVAIYGGTTSSFTSVIVVP